MRKNNLKEVEKKYFQTSNEKEENKDKKEKELRLIKDAIRENSPTQYNNTKICINLEENINQEDKNKVIDPIKIIEEPISYIPNVVKEKISGGYDINNIYQFLSHFSKGGLKVK